MKFKRFLLPLIVLALLTTIMNPLLGIAVFIPPPPSGGTCLGCAQTITEYDIHGNIDQIYYVNDGVDKTWTNDGTYFTAIDQGDTNHKIKLRFDVYNYAYKYITIDAFMRYFQVEYPDEGIAWTIHYTDGTIDYYVRAKGTYKIKINYFLWFFLNKKVDYVDMEFADYGGMLPWIVSVDYVKFTTT